MTAGADSRAQIKVTMAATPAGIAEWLGQDKEDIVHSCLAAVSCFEWPAVHESLSHEVGVGNVQPREKCNDSPDGLRL